MKRTIPVFLVVILLFSVAPLSGNHGGLFSASAKETEMLSGYKVGDAIQFGSYPQSLVTDDAIIKELNAVDGKWISYRYYSSDGKTYKSVKPSDYMKYRDVVVGEEKYRAVRFSKCRPYETDLPANDSKNSINGYCIDTTYWFKFEPIVWRVFDISEGLLISETILDSQAYNNYRICANGSLGYGDYGDNSYSYWASNYYYSSIRKWLNEEFYNTAFTDSQKAKIKTSHLQNKSTYSADYDSDNSDDNVFLPSYWDDINKERIELKAKGSDYAMAQGLSVISSSNYGLWWLRTPHNENTAGFVDYSGTKYVGEVAHLHRNYINKCTLGVRPAIRLKKGNLYSLSIGGICDADDTYGSRNSAAIFYQQLMDNDLSGYVTKEENVHTYLYDSGSSPVTLKQFNTLITNSFGKSTINDISFFTYSGHSTWDGTSGKNYGITLSKNSFIKWKDLAECLAKNAKGKIVVILDCCFAECFTKYGVEKLEKEDKDRFTVLMACGENEKSPTGSVLPIHFKLKYAYFSYYCGQGIGFFDGKLNADSNKDNKVTAGELYDYAKSKTKKRQNAKFYGDRGLVIFEFGKNVKIDKTSFVFNNKVQKPKVTVTNGKGKAISTSKYTIKWSNENSKNPGTYTVKVTFKGNLSGTKKYSYQITPRQVTGLTAAEFKKDSIKLSWTKLDEAKYYLIEQSTDGKTWTKAKTVSENSTTVKSLKAGKKYQFRVTALDKTKNVAGKISEVLKTQTLTAAPKISSLKSTKVKTATVKWSKVTGAKSYIVYTSKNGKKFTKAATTTKTTVTLKKLTAGKKVYMKVKAVNAYGKNSAYSAVKSVKVKK